MTDAQRRTASRGPCTAISAFARVTPATAVRAPHSSMVRNAVTPRHTRSVERRVISSGSSYEERWGYSRAVIVGDHIYVAGTAPIMPGDADPPPTPYEQMRRCLEIIGSALNEAGATFDDVVRTRVFVTDPAHAPEVMRAHGEAFATARPACTGIVSALLNERWLCELEVEAVRR